jgi:hypothetical protein
MTESEMNDFAMALVCEFASGNLTKFELNDWHLVLKAFAERRGVIQGAYYPSEDRVIQKSDLSHEEMLRTLFHECFHRNNGPDETKARIYASQRLTEWLNLTRREKQKRVFDAILSLKM